MVNNAGKRREETPGVAAPANGSVNQLPLVAEPEDGEPPVEPVVLADEDPDNGEEPEEPTPDFNAPPSGDLPDLPGADSKSTSAADPSYARAINFAIAIPSQAAPGWARGSREAKLEFKFTEAI